MRAKLLILLLVLLVVGAMLLYPCRVPAGEVAADSPYHVLAPIRHGNLTIFPVVAASWHDANGFLTLDEGLRSGAVVVTESGGGSPLIRPRSRGDSSVLRAPGAQVNQLVLVNNAKQPLLLLAGEIVTGGKQDRVIGKDRLVPAESDPIDLSVFCVEPGRWTGAKVSFGSFGSAMAQPGVRARAMADKDQEQVWSEVRKTQSAVAQSLPAPAAVEVGRTSSYAGVMANGEVKQRVDAIAEPMQRDFQSVIKQLREKNAVGVVVAVNGELVWADVFASPLLLEKYWPKLLRSYAAEAIVSRARFTEVSMHSAQAFLDDMQGRKEVVETEPGLYRHTEVTGEGFRAFQLTSLLPKTGFDLHVAKMAN